MTRNTFLQVTLLLFTLSTAQLRSQDLDEALLESSEESSEESQLFEMLQQLRSHPINLNRAGKEELARIPGLTGSQINEIMEHRRKHGGFNSLQELARVRGIGAETYLDIREFLTLDHKDDAGIRMARFSVRSRLIERLDRPIGFQDGTYSSSYKMYNRARFQLGEKVQGGVLVEKDSGERSIDDLRVFFAQINHGGFTLVAGNYSLEIGQDLVFWGPYGFSKGSEPITPVSRKARGIRGYLTVDENASLRGTAAKIRYGAFGLLAFVSRNKLDATPVSETDISGITVSGLHRTESETSKKDLVEESIIGAHLGFNHHRMGIGITYYANAFDKNILSPDLNRERFDFRGRSNTVAGIDWHWSAKGLDFFGEIARSRNNALAMLFGTILDFNPLRLSILHRNYAKNFHSSHGFAFAESNGSNQNERGYYIGLKYRFRKKTSLRAYYDIFQSSWRTFFEPTPVSGNDFMAQMEHRFSRNSRLLLRVQNKNKGKSETMTDAFGRVSVFLANQNTRRLRVQFDLSPVTGLRLRTRLEFNRSSVHSAQNSTRPENGFLIYQDLKLRISRAFRIAARVTLFQTDSFDARLFQYENDLPGVVTNRALFGRGQRRYILITFAPYPFLALHTKYDETYKNDTDFVGTGPDRIDGPLDRRFSLQIDLKR